jgi:hypothetical protein
MNKYKFHKKDPQYKKVDLNKKMMMVVVVVVESLHFNYNAVHFPIILEEKNKQKLCVYVYIYEYMHYT